jgi:RNase P/RNase MRP subunit p30
MKRFFIDLHLCPSFSGNEYLIQVIKKAKILGYNAFGFTINDFKDKRSIDLIKDFCRNEQLDFVSRIDLIPRNRIELKTYLRKVRRKYELICVICKNKEVARQAAQDRRVDLLNFPSLYFRNRFFDRNEAELASNSLVALEIDAMQFLTLKGSSRIRFLSFLRRETSIARDFHIPIILSSGVSKLTLIRKPRELAALMYLLDFDEASALDTVSTNPKFILTRNREKLDSSFVAPGIKIIKEGSS